MSWVKTGLSCEPTAAPLPRDGWWTPEDPVSDRKTLDCCDGQPSGPQWVRSPQGNLWDITEVGELVPGTRGYDEWFLYVFDGAADYRFPLERFWTPESPGFAASTAGEARAIWQAVPATIDDGTEGGEAYDPLYYFVKARQQKSAAWENFFSGARIRAFLPVPWQAPPAGDDSPGDDKQEAYTEFHYFIHLYGGWLRTALAAGLGGAGPGVALEDAVVAGLAGHLRSEATGGFTGTVGYAWSLIYGPGTATLADPGAAETDVQVSAPGVYVFQVTASDGTTSAWDHVQIRFVEPEAGASMTQAAPAFALAGQLLGASHPLDPGSDGATVAWSVVSGPGPVAFSDAAALDPVTTVGARGDYVVRLEVRIGETEASATVALGFHPLPIVTAGEEQVVLGLSAVLHGAATDFQGGAVAVSWLPVSGPGTPAFSDASAVQPTVTVDAPGLYYFQLTARDGATEGIAQTGVRFIVPDAGADAEQTGASPLVCSVFPQWLDAVTLPYTNPGGNVDGFAELMAFPDYLLKTDGATLYTEKATPATTPENGHFLQRIPAQVGGDFTFQAEVKLDANLFHSGVFVYFASPDNAAAWRFAACSQVNNIPVLQIDLFCDPLNNGPVTTLSEQPSTFDLGDWTLLTITRVGNRFTFSAGGQTLPPQATPLTGTGLLILSMNLANSYGEYDTVRWRNLSITSLPTP